MSGSGDGRMSPGTLRVKLEPEWNVLDECGDAAGAADLDVKTEVKWELEIDPEPLPPQDIAFDVTPPPTQPKSDDDKPRALTSLTTKYCFVKGCPNNSRRAPEKHFFSVPSANAAAWCRAAGRETIPKKRQLICDDHLNLEDDIENYTFWRMMSAKGTVKVRLKARLPASMRKGT